MDLHVIDQVTLNQEEWLETLMQRRLGNRIRDLRVHIHRAASFSRAGPNLSRQTIGQHAPWNSAACPSRPTTSKCANPLPTTNCSAAHGL